MDTDDLSVVFIGGAGRSGSTLLLRLLGTLDGFVPVGELSSIWGLYCLKNQMCGCGKAFRDCEFWSAVMYEAFGGVDLVDASKMLELRASIQGRHVPALAIPALRTHAFQHRVDEYAAVLSTLYQAIHKVSGCATIVDSSKQASYAFVVSEVPDIRPKLLHLVRDSRACAYSWHRKKRRAEFADTEVYMQQYSVLYTSYEWNVRNYLVPLASRRFASSAVFHYEDLASAPREVLTSIVGWLGVEDSTIPFISDDVVKLGSDHALWGNPNRFENGAIVIRPDDEWRTKMARSRRQVVTALTMPLLWKHGYLKESRRPRHTGATISGQVSDSTAAGKSGEFV